LVVVATTKLNNYQYHNVLDSWECGFFRDDPFKLLFYWLM
jgi:hypothetical protein